VRLNFVDHGENFANGENGMAELTDRVKQIYDTYANENKLDIYCLFSFRLENNKPQISFRYKVVKVSLKGV
jgi:hypothetical protein